MARFTIRWEVRFWDDAGLARGEAGEDVVDADDPGRACYEVGRRLAARFARPYTLTTTHDGESSGGTRYRGAYPTGLPDVDAVRARVRDGAAPAAVADELRGRGATPLAIMLAFEEAFGIDLDRLGDVPVVCAGGAARAAAAARLDAQIAALERRWDRPFRLR